MEIFVICNFYWEQTDCIVREKTSVDDKTEKGVENNSFFIGVFNTQSESN